MNIVAHILLVEDSVIARAAESSILEDLGCQVTLACTGREAVEKTEQAQHYTLVLMDLGLPDVDALTVTESILANYIHHQKTPPPIIALTAHAYESLREQCIRAGMLGFLAKPLTQDIVQILLKQYQTNE